MKGAHYSATGNTFLVVDSRNVALEDQTKRSITLNNVAGNDGVIFVETGFMDYFNRDGVRANFCGNGARTFVAYIFEKEGKKKVVFDSRAGEIEGVVEDNVVSVRMPGPIFSGGFEAEGFSGEIVTVGVPHLVIEGETDNVRWDRLIPLRHLYDANVNVYSVTAPGNLKIRTYERGVEGETGACGSGTTAVGWVYSRNTGLKKIEFQAPGGGLTVVFRGESAYLGGGVKKCSKELELRL